VKSKDLAVDMSQFGAPDMCAFRRIHIMSASRIMLASIDHAGA
jgi:hypothetical protein